MLLSCTSQGLSYISTNWCKFMLNIMSVYFEGMLLAKYET